MAPGKWRCMRGWETEIENGWIIVWPLVRLGYAQDIHIYLQLQYSTRFLSRSMNPVMNFDITDTWKPRM